MGNSIMPEDAYPTIDEIDIKEIHKKEADAE